MDSERTLTKHKTKNKKTTFFLSRGEKLTRCLGKVACEMQLAYGPVYVTVVMDEREEDKRKTERK